MGQEGKYRTYDLKGSALSGYAEALRLVSPQTLHPTPYTLHPTLYTLHPTPCTLHPTHFTLHLHPTPCTLHLTPSTLYPTPYTLYHTPYTLRPTPYTLHPTPYNLTTQRASRLCVTKMHLFFRAYLDPQHLPNAAPREINPEHGTHKAVKARFWPWLSGKSPSSLLSCALFAQKLFPLRSKVVPSSLKRGASPQAVCDEDAPLLRLPITQPTGPKPLYHRDD